MRQRREGMVREGVGEREGEEVKGLRERKRELG